LNVSARRKEWAARNIDAETQKWLDEDARYFLHQSLSTPCLNVLTACDGVYLEDLQGRRYLDFHGNSVHQVGFRNRRVIEAIKDQMETLPFCTRIRVRTTIRKVPWGGDLGERHGGRSLV